MRRIIAEAGSYARFYVLIYDMPVEEWISTTFFENNICSMCVMLQSFVVRQYCSDVSVLTACIS